ncbi:hypothetical protein [Micromonospora auratinigra]|uniref:Uncharacterized protein n=1 Tax=Micromonospora auratinigra TaxID=261654 RepID=A0A1A8ZMN0_9ACTN|nr:hypothetical protein [Micromonospora auratinigra]SBT45080.1 hypothetical protein GA0070611_2904 [Micromonospora auratinigra]
MSASGRTGRVAVLPAPRRAGRAGERATVGRRPPRRAPATPDPVAEGAQLERYKYILQQLHVLNENVYRFLALYQTLATTLVGAALALFVGYRKWEIDPATARAGVLGLLWLVTIVAAFTILLIVTGVLNWLDYRREECELTDGMIFPGFRRAPRVGNLRRWYETYIVLFIACSIGFMWWYALSLILPAMR